MKDDALVFPKGELLIERAGVPFDPIFAVITLDVNILVQAKILILLFLYTMIHHFI